MNDTSRTSTALMRHFHDPAYRASCSNVLLESACLLALAASLVFHGRAAAQTIQSRMPDEAAPHEGTWLQWPHQYTYGTTYRNRLDATWVDMTRALVPGEKVHVIAYDAAERTRITNLLVAASVPMTNVNFVLRQTDDCWVRDNGPIFVYDNSNQLRITDWGFNGWGFDTPYLKDNTVPVGVASALGLARVNLDAMVLEGGSIEIDGHGVLMATRSSILEPNRNPGLTQLQAQSTLTANLGVTKFIWLDGAPGGQEDITDSHIDGFAHFAPDRRIVTMSNTDLAYWGLSAADINTLTSATDVNNSPYALVRLPLSANNVVTTYGSNLGFKGSYVNYYVANTVVLVPIYADPNDAPALNILRPLYPGRTVVGIDCRNLYKNGGMVHCVTQQQPVFTLGCNSIDFNNDGVSPDSLDVADFLSVYGGGSCSNDPPLGSGCNDIDFNNDGVSPDSADVDALLSVFAGGNC